jgi:hypothetical protein
MSDFGTILNPNNNTLDLYCNSITTTATSDNYAYAILTSTTAQVVVPSGVSTTLQWTSSPSKSFENITLSGVDSLFTLEKIGKYLVDFNISAEIPSFAGAQLGVELNVNGTSTTFDVGFSNGVSIYNYKATLKALVSKPTDALVSLNFTLTATGFTGIFRYAQLSITKLE